MNSNKLSLDVLASVPSTSFNYIRNGGGRHYQKFWTYSEQRKKVKETSYLEHYKKHTILFDLTWVVGGRRRQQQTDDDDDDDDDTSFNFLVACTSKGEIIVWKIPLFVETNNSNANRTNILDKAVIRKQICDGKLYSIRSELVGGTKRLLIVSGDDGVLIFDWETDILNLLQNSDADDEKLTPTKRFRPYPSPLESRGVEVNDVQLLKQNGDNTILFGAAGDSFGVYKWDMETGQLLRNYTSPGSGYIHSIAIVPDGNSSNDNNNNHHHRPSASRGSILLAGSEGGILEFWDVNQDNSMGRIDLNTVSGADASSATTGIMNTTAGSTTARGSNKRAKSSLLRSRWISSVCAYDPNWFTVAGGSSSSSSTTGLRGGMNSNSNITGGGSGFLATYHQPTRSLVSWTDTREVPQQLTLLPTTPETMGSSVLQQHTLLSAANEGVVTHFNALSLGITRRQWCSPPSAYAAAVSEDGRYSAIGGVGSLVDILDSTTGEKWLTVSVC